MSFSLMVSNERFGKVVSVDSLKYLLYKSSVQSGDVLKTVRIIITNYKISNDFNYLTEDFKFLLNL